jgi:RNA polymerase sigma-70 factor (ECF subfamily)
MQPPNTNEIAKLLEPHVDALYRAAYRLTANRADAEDLVQEVCVRACAGYAELARVNHLRGWLLKVQYRVFVDGLRRRRRSPLKMTGEDFDAARCTDDPSPDELTEAAFAERRLLDAWPQLEKEQRALLALHVEGYTLAEIASITDLSTDVLKARLYRARVRLGKLLAKHANGVLATGGLA